MAATIGLSLLGVALAVGGLVLAASVSSGALQALGVAILILAWIAMVGYHGRQAERRERERLGLLPPPKPVPSILTREWSMIQSLAISFLFVLMGLGLLVLSWFFIVGFHGRRAEAEARARAGTSH